MEENWPQGSLTDIPFAQLLFNIWKEEKSGYLNIKKDKVEKSLCLQRGKIVVKQGAFPEKIFLETLVKKNILDSSMAKKHQDFAAKNKPTLIKALIELNTLSPSRLWKLMETYQKQDLYPLFNWQQGEYFLDSDNLPQQSEVLLSIQTLSFILQGVRRTENFDLIEAHIPPEKSRIQILQPRYLNQIKLESPEEYLLNMIEEKDDLKSIIERSQLGKKQSKKILFGLLILGIIGLHPNKTRESLYQEDSPVELHKILETFSHKCAYIHKYISKEIGPAALNVLGKCLEETKSCLSPLSRRIELGEGEKINMNSILKANLSLLSEEDRKALLRDLNEILAAEILAVKKTLGNEHESTLVKNLEKIGEQN